MSAAAEGESGEDGEAVPQAGVLGNLPRTRPAVRSPRRKEQPAAAKSAAESRPRKSEPASEPEEREVPPPNAAPPPAGDVNSGAASDLEALARGGIAVAGEAASLGLRIAGRAAAAIRDSVERR